MRYFCLWGGGGGKRGSKLTHPLKGFRSWHITTYVARRSDSDGERVLKWFPARGFWLTTRFLEQFGINKHLFQRLQIAPALRVVFEKNYSCELKSNCTRNHVIIYTNSERQDEQAARCKEQQVMNIASMWLAAWRTTVIWFVHSASPRYRERAFTIYSPFRYNSSQATNHPHSINTKVRTSFRIFKVSPRETNPKFKRDDTKAWMRIGDWVMDREEWGKWGMETGEWGVGSGEWGMENGKWTMGSGEWEM